MYSSIWDILVDDVSLCGIDRLIVFRPKKRFFLDLKLKKRIYLCLDWKFHCDKLMFHYTISF